jgi:hydroxylamine dehydrogenase
MKHLLLILCAFYGLQTPFAGFCEDGPVVSAATQQCLDCHSTFHPGIVEDWKKSRHAVMTPEKAMGAAALSRKVSGPSIPDAMPKDFLAVVVGCAECHTQRPASHADTFSHNGFDVHVVVSPEDCAACHSQERDQYGGNIMSHAWKNLAENKIYQDLKQTIIGNPVRKSGKLAFDPPDALTNAEACFYCHGTRLTVTGFEKRDTDAGELEFPVINGWPNQGVGRINPDGSKGACTACHNRHSFSMETARKPYTCKECHTGPDVPAYKVYEVSKHGNIAASKQSSWDFQAVPWTVGRDFTAPTCAACHISLLTNTDGEVIVQRTHRMNDRLSTRIFGLIYAHRHPKSPDTTLIRNNDGLGLPTDFDGAPASQYLIDDTEFGARQKTLQAVCLSCHSLSWVKGHWQRYEHTIQTTNAATRTATDIMREIWKKGYASGLERGASPFDESIEKKWSAIWLFDANNSRFASAMAGGGDYGVFAEGRYALSTRVAELNEWLLQKGKKD